MVPITGAEYPFEAKYLNQERVDIVLIEGGSGQKCVCTGQFTSVSRAGGVGQNYQITFEFSGSADEFS